MDSSFVGGSQSADSTVRSLAGGDFSFQFNRDLLLRVNAILSWLLGRPTETRRGCAVDGLPPAIRSSAGRPARDGSGVPFEYSGGRNRDLPVATLDAGCPWPRILVASFAALMAYSAIQSRICGLRTAMSMLPP